MEEKDRLTKYNYDNYKNIKCVFVDDLNQALLTLAEYEDTNLSPQEVEQLKKENEELKGEKR